MGKRGIVTKRVRMIVMNKWGGMVIDSGMVRANLREITKNSIKNSIKNSEKFYEKYHKKCKYFEKVTI